MNPYLLVGAALLGAALSAPAQDQPQDPQAPQTEPVWIADFDRAVEVAKKGGKDLFVDFTGSDWCGWCKRLDREVFAHEEFLKPVTEDYVLVALDFPNSEAVKARVPNPERNQELQEQYGIRGFPTILLMTTEGDVYARTCYQQGGPEQYVAHLREIATKGKQDLAEVKALVAQAEGADGTTTEKLLHTAAAKLTEMDGDSAGVGTLAAFVRKGIELDPGNEKGLKAECVKALLAAGQVDDALLAAATELDPKNEQGMLEGVVAARCRSVASREDVIAALDSFAKLHALGIKDKELAAELYTNTAYWAEKIAGTHEVAVVYAKKALELGPPEGAVKMLEGIVGG